jgi:bile acid:Na+ symporter, BASS family
MLDMFNQFIKILDRTDIVYILSIVFALIIQVDPSALKYGIQIALGVMMFLSLRPLFKKKINLISSTHYLFSSLIMNYVVLSGAYLLVGYTIFRGNPDLSTGYFLLAIVPPAIAIMPLCYLSKCNLKAAESSLIVSFLISLLVIPGALYLAFGKNVDIMMLLKLLLMLIVIPMLFAYIFAKSEAKIFNYNHAIINLCLGVIIFITIALNKTALMTFPVYQLALILIINIMIIFGIASLVYVISKRFVKRDMVVELALYASNKNDGTSATLAILLFSPTSAIPATIAIGLQLLFFLFIGKFSRNKA